MSSSRLATSASCRSRCSGGPIRVLPVVAWVVWAAACTEPNQAPFSCDPTSPQTVAARDSVSFSPCFTDPDGDPLTIGAEVAHHQQVYAEVTVSGGNVTIHGRREHALLPLMVTATDPFGASVTEEVEVSVRGLHDLAVPEAWPDTQTVRGGEFRLNFVIANVGETYAKISEWTLRTSSDSVITVDDAIYPGAFRLVIHNISPGGTLFNSQRFVSFPDPGVPYFGLCGVSRTPEYNLDNNCSKGLRVIFPDLMTRAGEPSHVVTVTGDVEWAVRSPPTPPPPPGGPVP